MDPNTLVALAGIEYGLVVFASFRGLSVDAMVIFVMVLLLRPHELGPLPLVVAGIAGYSASLLWRFNQVPTRVQVRFRGWLYRRGVERAVDRAPRTPVLIAGATSLVVLMPDAFSFVTLIGFVVATAWSSFEWRRDRFSPPTRAMAIAASANVLGLAGILAIAVGALHWAAPATAKELLPQLIGVQIALGLLPLTVLTFATQFVAGAAGAGAAFVLPWTRVGRVVALVLASIAYDFYLLGSAPIGGDLEWAELIAFAAVAISLLTGAAAMYYLRPGRVAVALVQRLNADWLDEVVRTYQEPFQPWFGSDPFRDIERLLYIAATKESDIRLFNATLQDLEERFAVLVSRRAPTVPPRVEIALDEYLARVLSALVQEAARQRKGWVLESLVWFRGQFSDRVVEGGGPRGPAATRRYIERTFRDAPPSGLQMLGRILEAAIEAGLDEEGSLAAIRFGAYAEQSLVLLPDPTGVYDIDPTAPIRYDGDAPAQEAANGLEAVLGKMQRWAYRSADLGQYLIADSLARGISMLSSSSRSIGDARWARWLSRESALAAFSVASRGLKKQQLWYDVPSRIGDFTRADQSQASAVEGMSFWTPYTIATCAPVADYMLIVNATMLALSLAREFLADAAAVGAALEYIRRRQLQMPSQDERQLVIREVDSRAQQLRAAVPAGRLAEFDDAKAAFAARLERELDPPRNDSQQPGGEVF